MHGDSRERHALDFEPKRDGGGGRDGPERRRPVLCGLLLVRVRRKGWGGHGRSCVDGGVRAPRENPKQRPFPFELHRVRLPRQRRRRKSGGDWGGQLFAVGPHPGEPGAGGREHAAAGQAGRHGGDHWLSGHRGRHLHVRGHHDLHRGLGPELAGLAGRGHRRLHHRHHHHRGRHPRGFASGGHHFPGLLHEEDGAGQQPGEAPAGV
mmetsp:Transcript_69602/g.130998  ORF Transcript_69602/g.130998 Transcript_69602/m.130998 type:complete len:207 (+) Transcript_69602:534-1154(+)